MHFRKAPQPISYHAEAQSDILGIPGQSHDMGLRKREFVIRCTFLFYIFPILPSCTVISKAMQLWFLFG
jgi:hypothetical protein